MTDKRWVKLLQPASQTQEEFDVYTIKLQLCKNTNSLHSFFNFEIQFSIIPVLICIILLCPYMEIECHTDYLHLSGYTSAMFSTSISPTTCYCDSQQRSSLLGLLFFRTSSFLVWYEGVILLLVKQNKWIVSIYCHCLMKLWGDIKKN